MRKFRIVKVGGADHYKVQEHARTWALGPWSRIFGSWEFLGTLGGPSGDLWRDSEFESIEAAEAEIQKIASPTPSNIIVKEIEVAT